MDLARIFDLSQGKNAHPAEEQTKASIPVLAALLTRPDVQDGLLQDAAKWIADTSYRSLNVDACQKAITDFLALAHGLKVEDSEENAALVRIRQFRDRRLAHSLFDQEPNAWPRYADLDLLLGVAKEATQHASFAVEGLNVDFDDMAQEDRKNAEGYYASVLDGLKRAARRREP
jgi:hypothetical protein